MDGVFLGGFHYKYEYSNYVYNFFPILKIFQKCSRLIETETEIKPPPKGKESSLFKLMLQLLFISKNNKQIPVVAPDITKIVQNYFTQRK